jgi:hypothetical protein
MNLEALTLHKAFYTGGLGVNVKRLLLPVVAPDVQPVTDIEVHTEIDVDGVGAGTANARTLAMNQMFIPTAGKIGLGLSIARPGATLDARYLPPVRTHQIPILHTYARKVADGAKGARQLSYAIRAGLWTLEEFKQDTQAAARSIGDVPTQKLLLLLRVMDIIPVPMFQATEDSIATQGYVVVWDFRDTKPRGV